MKGSFLGLILLLAFTWQLPDDLARQWRESHLVEQFPSNLRHADVKQYVMKLRDAGVKTVEVGKSMGSKEIYQLEFGTGPFRLFLWSQMHGDEPTATAALLDVFAFLQRNRSKPWVDSIARSITIRAVPMLNPDGGDLYQRRNLQFIDINRDARNLVTAEGQLLKRLRDEWKPQMGFNLHNQNPRTAVGDTRVQATIALLAVAFDESGKDNPGRVLAKKACAIIYNAISPRIPGRISRYEDAFNPRAFGDLIGSWGTPVVLIETGGWQGRTESELVELNFVALLSVFRSIADGSIEKADPQVYNRLLYNESSALVDLMIRNGKVVNRTLVDGKFLAPFKADVSVNFESQKRPSERTGRLQIQDIGDLSDIGSLQEVDATGYVVTVADGVLRQGAEAALLFYRESRTTEIAWDARDLESRFPPDAVFRAGKWSGKDIPPRKEK